MRWQSGRSCLRGRARPRPALPARGCAYFRPKWGGAMGRPGDPTGGEEGLLLVRGKLGRGGQAGKGAHLLASSASGDWALGTGIGLVLAC